MGLHITLAFHQIDDLVIDDIQKLNDDLMKPQSSFSELYDDIEDPKGGFQGPFKVSDAGDLQIACNCDNYFEGYDNYTTVWGCWGESVANIIANHITAGKLVLLEEIEGNPNVFWILTPGVVQSKSEDDIRF